MDSLFSLKSKTEGRVAARLKDFGVFNDSHKASPFGADGYHSRCQCLKVS